MEVGDMELREKIYLPQLNLFRFLAASWVVVYHYGTDDFVQFPILHGIACHGDIAVSFFFLLSGFVLTISRSNTKEISLKGFMIRRFARIWPVHFLGMLSYLFVLMVLDGGGPKGVSVLMQFFCLQSWVPKYALGLNLVSWSISVEFSLYLFFALSYKYWIKNINFFYVLIPFFLIQLFLLDFLEEQATVPIEFLKFNPVWHIATFLTGCWFAEYTRKSVFIENKGRDQVIFLVGGILLACLTYASQGREFCVLWQNSAFVLLFLFVISLLMKSNHITEFLSIKLFVILGEVSFSMYLLQVVVYDIAMKKLGLDFIVYFFLLLMMAVIVYYNFELPIKKKIILKLLKR